MLQPGLQHRLHPLLFLFEKGLVVGLQRLQQHFPKTIRMRPAIQILDQGLFVFDGLFVAKQRRERGQIVFAPGATPGDLHHPPGFRA